MKRQFSEAQETYMIARAAFDIARKAHRDYDAVLDAECIKLGIETPYGILPDGHPAWVEAQRLLDVENESSKAMYAAARNLFDWASESTLHRMGTEDQKVAIRAMVAKVKKMAFVEKFFIELVDSSMRLSVSGR